MTIAVLSADGRFANQAPKAEGNTKAGITSNLPPPPHHSDSESLALPEEIPRSFSPWSDMSSNPEVDSHIAPSAMPSHSEQPLASAKKDVEEVIDHLARLTVAIRKTGTISRFQKADRVFSPEDHQSLQAHLEIVIRSRGTEGAWEGFQAGPNSLTGVQTRLIHANLRRRNRFLYAQRHAEKLAFEKPLPHIPPPQPVPSVIRSTELKSHALTPSQRVPAQKPVTDSFHDLTATSASQVQEKIPHVPVRIASPSQAAMTQITTTAAKISYPHPPKLQDGHNTFKCPCCCQTLPAMFQQSTQWK